VVARFMILASLTLVSCTGQTILAPMNVTTTRGATLVHSAPIFRNSGNLVNVDYHYQGPAGTVDFHAETVDNSTTTYSMWEGLVKMGRAIIQPIVYGVTAAAAAPALAAQAR
jgi:hypothetical protein